MSVGASLVCQRYSEGISLHIHKRLTIKHTSCRAYFFMQYVLLYSFNLLTHRERPIGPSLFGMPVPQKVFIFKNIQINMVFHGNQLRFKGVLKGLSSEF
jgi:hypothetical protein